MKTRRLGPFCLSESHRWLAACCGVGRFAGMASLLPLQLYADRENSGSVWVTVIVGHVAIGVGWPIK